MTNSRQQDAFLLLANVSNEDQWEFDRQQNIINEIDKTASYIVGDENPPPLTVEEQTAAKRRAESVAIQNYLISVNVQSDDVNAAIDQLDQDWIALNPPPSAPV